MTGSQNIDAANGNDSLMISDIQPYSNIEQLTAAGHYPILAAEQVRQSEFIANAHRYLKFDADGRVDAKTLSLKLVVADTLAQTSGQHGLGVSLSWIADVFEYLTESNDLNLSEIKQWVEQVRFVVEGSLTHRFTREIESRFADRFLLTLATFSEMFSSHVGVFQDLLLLGTGFSQSSLSLKGAKQFSASMARLMLGQKATAGKSAAQLNAVQAWLGLREFFDSDMQSKVDDYLLNWLDDKVGIARSPLQIWLKAYKGLILPSYKVKSKTYQIFASTIAGSPILFDYVWFSTVEAAAAIKPDSTDFGELMFSAVEKAWETGNVTVCNFILGVVRDSCSEMNDDLRQQKWIPFLNSALGNPFPDNQHSRRRTKLNAKQEIQMEVLQTLLFLRNVQTKLDERQGRYVKSLRRIWRDDPGNYTRIISVLEQNLDEPIDAVSLAFKDDLKRPSVAWRTEETIEWLSLFCDKKSAFYSTELRKNVPVGHITSRISPTERFAEFADHTSQQASRRLQPLVDAFRMELKKNAGKKFKPNIHGFESAFDLLKVANDTAGLLNQILTYQTQSVIAFAELTSEVPVRWGFGFLDFSNGDFKRTKTHCFPELDLATRINATTTGVANVEWIRRFNQEKLRKLLRELQGYAAQSRSDAVRVKNRVNRLRSLARVNFGVISDDNGEVLRSSLQVNGGSFVMLKSHGKSVYSSTKFPEVQILYKDT